MITFKEYYKIAYENIKNFIGTEPIDFRLEQYAKNKKSNSVEFVISYLTERKAKSKLDAMLPSQIAMERIYKQISFNSKNQVEKILIFDK